MIICLTSLQSHTYSFQIYRIKQVGCILGLSNSATEECEWCVCVCLCGVCECLCAVGDVQLHKGCIHVEERQLHITKAVMLSDGPKSPVHAPSF